MRISRHKIFTKQFKKLPEKVKQKFFQRLAIFVNDPFSPELHNHSLSGKYVGLRSINVTGDIRALYEVTGNDEITFKLIDDHSGLYD